MKIWCLTLLILITGCGEKRTTVGDSEPAPISRGKIIESFIYRSYYRAFLIEIDNKEYIIVPNGGIIEHKIQVEKTK